MPTHRYFLNDFVEIQRKSFFDLLEKGLIDEINKRNPITNAKNDFEVYFYPEYYKLTRPEYSPRQAIILSKSYTGKLYIPVQFTDKKQKISKLKWVYIGNIPLMTKRGHFILNGAARVIVNQIIRSPGIYYQQKLYENFNKKWSQKPEDSYIRYYADIICQRGAWLRLEIDKEKNIWAQMKKGPKIPIFVLLLAMGIPEKKIFLSIESQRSELERTSNPTRLVGNLDIITKEQSADLERNKKIKKKKTNYPYIKNPSEAWKVLHNLTKTDKKQKKNVGKIEKNDQKSLYGMPVASLVLSHSLPLEIAGRQWIYNKFMNPRTYDLGKQGRFAINKKLGSGANSNILTLTPLDILYATNYLIKVEKGAQPIDDIDHLKNRRVRTSGELIQIQIGVGLVRLEKSIRDAMNKRSFINIDQYINENIGQHSKTLRVSAFFRSSFSTTLAKKDQPISPPHSVRQIKRLSEPRALFAEQHALHHKNIMEGERQPALAQFPKGERALEEDERKLIGEHARRTHVKNVKVRPVASFPKVTSNKEEFKNYNLSSLINTKGFNSAIREFFGTSPLSQFMDQINPLAEITHKRRLSSMGPGGVTRDNATLDIRGIHPTHYGRICPIETPEGKNTGLVNSMTAYARVNQNGIIESPFYKVYKGQVQKKAGMYYFSAEQEEKITLAAADLFVSSIGFLPKASIPVRISEDFTKRGRNEVEYIGVSPIQMISIATSLIPFLEHDDANRALMGSNMQRQAVPLIRPERPIVGTGLEGRAISDSGHILQSKQSGLVTYVSGKKICIYTL
uniref:DNA-directed RNA polymerase n=1 Tax=Characiochloris acuminata TaxID=167768 RepID=A0A0S2LPZ6_9CHLO|nr:beta subunit of RNA polymerase [Characiochloris acuminata]ALO63306.1 beta subunit of RNA polymerase [Characiochloris acuminata]